MQLQIHGQNLITTPSLREHMETRIEAALDRVAHSIRTVVLRFKDVNGPRGGADKRVHLCIRFNNGEEVFIEDCDRDVYHVVNRIAGRAKHVVKRQLQKRRSRRRAA